MYFKKPNVAIDIGKMGVIDLRDRKKPFDELINYMNETNSHKLDVITYLWDKSQLYDSLEIAIDILSSWFGCEDIISEEELGKLKDVRVVNRG